MLNKKAQISDTTVWVVATVIILLVLTSAIFINSLSVGKGKVIEKKPTADILATKSFSSYLLTKILDDKTVYQQLQSQENLDDSTGPLAKKIFIDFYGKDYPNKLATIEGDIYKQGIWLGVHSDGDYEILENNNYFGKRPSVIRIPAYVIPVIIANPSTIGVLISASMINIDNHVLRRVELKENKYIDLLLVEEKDE